MKIISALVIALTVTEAKKERTPDWRVNQLHGKIGDVMDNHFDRWNNWSARMLTRSRKIADNMIADYNKKMNACMDGSGEGSGEGMEGMDMDERSDRYDVDDPCRAARQLTRNMITWSKNYNVHRNCDTMEVDIDADMTFHNKVANQWGKFEAKMKRKGKCAV